MGKIQWQLSLPSDAELTMLSNLKDISHKMKDEVSVSMEQVRAKEKYQSKQIVSSANLDSWRSPPPIIEDNQIQNITDILHRDGKKISTLIKQINSIKKIF